MSRKRSVVLVVDREGADTARLIAFLSDRDLDVVWAHDGEAAFNVMDGRPVDCMVTALREPRIDGMRLLRRVRERNPGMCAVVITESADVEMAVEAMRQGAYDFQVKPLNLDKLIAVLQRGLSDQALAARMAEIEGRLDERLGFERLTGPSRVLQRVMEQVRHVAPTRTTVLLEGESGTGKGLVARAIHQHSPRKDEPFVSLLCASLEEGVLEGELFGVTSDSAADVSGPRRGRFEVADGGTLFLDEIGETPPGVQVKLLRVLQDRSFERVGGDERVTTDTRLVAATSRDLAAEVAAGRFRADLFTRLGVVRIQMPALRDRLEDVPSLVEGFIRESNRAHGRKITGITRGALERLLAHAWPGNVRELKATIDGMVVFAEGKRAIDLSDLPVAFRGAEGPGAPLAISVGMTVGEAERQLITATLHHTGGDKPRAAALLGIGLRTLYRKLEQCGIR